MFAYRVTPSTDTDDTDDDRVVGGHSMYSHNSMCLNHQHWVDQVISAGGFNVHCTEGPESSHKFNMHVAAARVRHGASSNDTQTNMLQYTCEQLLFQTILELDDGDKTTRTVALTPGLQRPLDFKFNRDLCSASFRRTFIHHQVRLTVEELLLLLCDKLGLPKTTETFRKFKHTHITLGTKFISRVAGNERGQMFCGADNTRSNVPSRRDMLLLKGVLNGDALCAEALCFVNISNLETLAIDVNDLRTLAIDANADDVDMVLVRWLTPHSDSWERDSVRRPVCPGPLHVNNCLWKYASAGSNRSSIVRTNGQPTAAWVNQRSLFGETESDQQQCWERETQAYFGLVTPKSIVDTMHMCPIFKSGSADPDDDTWLQTVKLL